MVIETCCVTAVVGFGLWWLFPAAFKHHVRSGVHTAIDAFADQTVHNRTNDHIDNVVHVHGALPKLLHALD